MDEVIGYFAARSWAKQGYEGEAIFVIFFEVIVHYIFVIYLKSTMQAILHDRNELFVA